MGTPSIIVALFDAWVVIMALFIAGYLLNLNRAWRRLQEFHPDTSEELGRPGLFKTDPRIVFGARKYLWSAKCASLNDTILLHQSRMSRVCLMAGGAMFLGFAALIIASSIMRS